METAPTQTPWAILNDPDRKRKYAALARSRPDTDIGRFEAASLTFPEPEYDSVARQAFAEYRYDRVVIEETSRLAREEPEAELPSKAQQARDIYNLATGATSVDDKLKAHKLYAEIMGFVQKPGATPVNLNIDNRRVMIMPAPAPSEDAWEANAEAQQRALVGNATR